jgi:DNA-binding response OmpR family regulator
MATRVLVADDRPDLDDSTARSLRAEGFVPIIARDGTDALRRWRAEKPDVVVLDVALPHLNGIDVCRRIRQRSPTPVIMVSAAADEEQVVQSFRAGADDYLTKPFRPRELAVRIRALLRRQDRRPEPAPPSVVCAASLMLFPPSREVQYGTQRVRLTPHEFGILYLLAMNPGRVVSFRTLLEYAWGYPEADHHRLKSHVSHLRHKLGLVRGQPGDVGVIPRAGYYLIAASAGS